MIILIISIVSICVGSYILWCGYQERKIEQENFNRQMDSYDKEQQKEIYPDINQNGSINQTHILRNTENLKQPSYIRPHVMNSSQQPYIETFDEMDDTYVNPLDLANPVNFINPISPLNILNNDSFDSDFNQAPVYTPSEDISPSPSYDSSPSSSYDSGSSFSSDSSSFSSDSSSW